MCSCEIAAPKTFLLLLREGGVGGCTAYMTGLSQCVGKVIPSTVSKSS